MLSQFFLRGTQLQQLTEEYEQIRSNTESMEEALNRKKEVIPELKEAYKRAKARHVEAEAAEGQSQKVVQLKDELCWAYVGEKEDVSFVLNSALLSRGWFIVLSSCRKFGQPGSSSTPRRTKVRSSRRTLIGTT